MDESSDFEYASRLQSEEYSVINDSDLAFQLQEQFDSETGVRSRSSALLQQPSSRRDNFTHRPSTSSQHHPYHENLSPLTRARTQSRFSHHYNTPTRDNYDRLVRLGEMMGDVPGRGLSKREVDLLPTFKYLHEEHHTSSGSRSNAASTNTPPNHPLPSTSHTTPPASHTTSSDSHIPPSNSYTNHPSYFATAPSAGNNNNVSHSSHNSYNCNSNKQNYWKIVFENDDEDDDDVCFVEEWEVVETRPPCSFSSPPSPRHGNHGDGISVNVYINNTNHYNFSARKPHRRCSESGKGEEGTHFTSKPNSSEVIDLSALADAEGTTGGPCEVCLCEYQDGETLRTLPCLHHFHMLCIDPWITKNAVCPICRFAIKEVLTLA